MLNDSGLSHREESNSTRTLRNKYNGALKNSTSQARVAKKTFDLDFEDDFIYVNNNKNADDL